MKGSDTMTTSLARNAPRVGAGPRPSVGGPAGTAVNLIILVLAGVGGYVLWKQYGKK
jgi:hypothetical protein